MNDLAQQAKSLLDAGDASTAIELLDRYLKERPRDAAAIALRAQAYLKKLDRARALNDLTAALAIKPSEHPWRDQRATLLMQQRCWGQAVDDLKLLIEHDANRADYVTRRGFCYSMLGDSARAIADYDLAITLGDSQAQAFKQQLVNELSQSQFSE